MMQAPAPKPTDILLKTAERRLDLTFDDGVTARLPAEYLRVYSPSAEVTGHGADERKTIPGKAGVAIERVEPVGHYALRIVFDDGHASGLYTWPYLYDLSVRQEEKWAAYLKALAARGLSR